VAAVGSAGESILVLLGPTATGKSAVGIELARRLDGEIISADSRAFFRGLDIVAAVPTPEERRSIPHHLVGVVPLDASYDAMAFRRDVERLVPEIRGRGRVPLVVGGGTLYLGAILRGLFEGPAKDPAFRRRLADRPVGELHERLARVDPEAARAIHPNDRLRLERALEVYETSGRPISAWRAEAEPLAYPFYVVGLYRSRDDHRAAIAARVRGMLDAGLLREAADLRRSGLNERDQAYRTIGIPEAMARLDGSISEGEMVDAIVSQSWALARRQRAWFRRDRGVRWIDVTGRTAADVADEILEGWRKETR
jgi:tRNA dimethylallyltransferase